MKIYHVEFQNQKYNENDKQYSVVARNIVEAESKAIKVLKKQVEKGEVYGFGNWQTTKVEWVDEIL